MTDVIGKCKTANPIDKGGIIVNAPRAGTQLGSNYQINTYSSSLPNTWLVFNKYDPRFTGIAPCVNECNDPEVVGSGAVCVLWV